MGSHSVTCHPAEVTFLPLLTWVLVDMRERADLVEEAGVSSRVCWWSAVVDGGRGG